MCRAYVRATQIVLQVDTIVDRSKIKGHIFFWTKNGVLCLHMAFLCDQIAQLKVLQITSNLTLALAFGP